jgi:hypothetical protein
MRLNSNRYENSEPFFNVELDEDGREKITISNSKLIVFWESLGYRKVVNDNGDYILVLIKSNSIVVEIKEHMLREEIRKYTYHIGNENIWIKYLEKEYVVKKLFESFHTIKISRNNGNENTGYLYYQNFILKVSSDKTDLIEYENFDGFIWEKEIIKRDFVSFEKAECVFGDFIKIIANDDTERLKSIISIIGYLIHSFKNPSCAKAIILMDSEIDVEFNEANGGTGKSLIGKAVGQIVSNLFIDGKTIKSQDKFRLSALNSHHRIIFFDDVKKEFDFESLYPIITGDLYIEKKYKNAIVIPSSETPKILITSNYVVKGGGGNAEKRRKVEYEVSTYFKNVLTPKEEFGHQFFDDWDKEEWTKFDNFMVLALQFYLKKGLIEPKSINIDYNRLKIETSVDFIDFMDNIISMPQQYQKPALPNVLVIDKNKLFSDFLNTKPNTAERITPITIKKWIDRYCNYYNIETSHYKSNGNVFVELNISNLTSENNQELNNN